MPGLSFSIIGAKAISYAAIPTIGFELHLASPVALENVALRCQIMIQPSHRSYAASEREKLSDLFGAPDRWSQTLKPFLWTHATAAIPAFSGTVTSLLTVPCSFDFNVAATKYFHALQDGSLPLSFQFSGTIFYKSPGGALQIDQIDWGSESSFNLPAEVWTEMMEHYYPDSAWLRVGRAAFERLGEYKRRQGLATWEQAIDQLLPLTKEAVS
jgi:Family of unknown function (DUF6084)